MLVQNNSDPCFFHLKKHINMRTQTKTTIGALDMEVKTRKKQARKESKESLLFSIL